jgi:hypothetical membrane protein
MFLLPRIAQTATIPRKVAMKRFHPSFISGLAITVGYVSFACMAYMRYPIDYSPLANWLSDLGNPVVNPRGAILYNTGVILTAVLLIIFFLGLYSWEINGNRVQTIMLRLTQTFGILGALSMLMSAVYPINHYEAHAILSTMLYILLSTAFIFSVAMLRYHTAVPRWMFFVGIFSAIIVILTGVFQNVTGLEWITVLFLLGYTVLLSFETRINENLAMERNSG